MNTGTWTRGCESAHCVEVMAWRTACESSACVEVSMWVEGCGDTDCVKAGQEFDTVKIRDSKDPDGPVLTFTREEWDGFVSGIKAGAFE